VARVNEYELACAELGSPEVQRRTLLSVPALARRVQGDDETSLERTVRNVAWHSANLPAPGAPPACWKQAQKGPRLHSVVADRTAQPSPRASGGLRASAPGFVPGVGQHPAIAGQERTGAPQGADECEACSRAGGGADLGWPTFAAATLDVGVVPPASSRSSEVDGRLSEDGPPFVRHAVAVPAPLEGGSVSASLVEYPESFVVPSDGVASVAGGSEPLSPVLPLLSGSSPSAAWPMALGTLYSDDAAEQTASSSDHGELPSPDATPQPVSRVIDRLGDLALRVWDSASRGDSRRDYELKVLAEGTLNLLEEVYLSGFDDEDELRQIEDSFLDDVRRLSHGDLGTSHGVIGAEG